MGTLIGHVAPGVGFMLIGLWHLLNTIKAYGRQGDRDFVSRPWFPAAPPGHPRRRAELYLIISGSLLSIASELFIFPHQHHPFVSRAALSIPAQHLNNFEHSTISLFLLMYASVAVLEDRGVLNLNLAGGFVHSLGSLAFAVELLLFHLHSADHMGLEGHYHWLLQLIVSACLVFTLVEIHTPRSFLASLGRATSIVFQGIWFIQMGLVLWVPRFTPTGCAMRDEGYHRLVRCEGEAASHRAKALATLQFAWYLAALCAAVVTWIALALRGPHANMSKSYEALHFLHDPDDNESDPSASFKLELPRATSLEGLHGVKSTINLPR